MQGLIARSLGCRFVLAFAIASFVCADRANAIGWDSDDFLIGGGSSFTDRIGVFNHDLTFKGYLDPFFPTVAGMDFDGAGHLVAVGSAIRSVRVYESSGTLIGGFTRQDDLLGTPGDLKVAPDGSYIIATRNFGGGNGARQFTPTGDLIREYDPSNADGVAVVPGNRMWSSGPNQPVFIYDLATGASVGSFSAPGGHGGHSMFYSATTNTALLLQRSEASIFEVDLSGQVVRTFVDPLGQLIGSMTRGPSNDVFATSDDSILRWHANGDYTGRIPLNSFGGWIAWAGNVPEPGTVAALAILVLPLVRGRTRGRRKR